jgi:FkbM family methyltransferase
VLALTKTFLRAFWRTLLRLQRLWRVLPKLGLLTFLWFVFIDRFLNPAAGKLKISNRCVNITALGYAGPFVLRLGSTDAECFLEVILEGEYETALRLAHPDAALVFDAGSNVGYSVRYFQRAFPSAVIIGIEPDADNMAVCRRNVSLGEKPERVFLYEYCVAGRSGSVQLDRSAGAWGTRMQPAWQQDSEHQIPARTADQILKEAGVSERRVDLFKCDIEGAEAELFREPGVWLERSDCLAVETHAPYYDVCLIADLHRFSNDFECFPENEMVFARRSSVRDSKSLS